MSTGGVNMFLKKRQQFINATYVCVLAAKIRLKKKTSQFINAAYVWILAAKIHLKKKPSKQIVNAEYV